MTKEETQLLLQDLCGRIPYNTKFNFGDNAYVMTGIRLFVTDDCEWDYGVTSKDIAEPVEIGFIKPYLRPMSSMTKEEKTQYYTLCCIDGDLDNIVFYDNIYSINYLNSIHVDYRELIDKGLALEAPDNMYELK